jgi:NADH-quinone oxidoreductase subunit L
MTWPLIVLSIFALAIGGIVAKLFDGFNGFLSRTPGLAGGHPSHSTAVMLVSSLVALGGVALAWVMYGRPSTLSQTLALRLRGAYELSRDQFRFDQLYAALVVRPMLVLAEICRLVEDWVIDGMVRFVGAIPALFGRVVLRPIQNGLVQYYALGMLLGLAVLVVALAGWLR